MTRITKVKWDCEKVRIEYEKKRPDGRGYDEYSLQSIDLPTTEFVQALSALSADVVMIGEFPEGDAKKLTVRGVTCTHTEDILGVVITALKTLKTSAAPLVLNTPHLPETPYGDGASGTPVLDQRTVDRVHDLLLAAERYVNGERANQSSLLTEASPQESRTMPGGLLSEARLHESLARIGDPSGDGSTKASFGISGGEMHEIDPQKHRDIAKKLRSEAAKNRTA